MKRMFIGLIVLFYSSYGFTAGLEKQKTYRLEKSVFNLIQTSNNESNHVAARNSIFIVVDPEVNPNAYLVRFLTIYNSGDTVSTVKKDQEYLLPILIGGTNIVNSVKQSLVGPVSGPLIVPFKFRRSDRTIWSESAIGYYAGYRTEIKIGTTDARIPVSPFVAGGITQVNVGTNTDIDNKSGLSFAIGILVQNWANVNIGFVVGQDRIGDPEWKYEGDPWGSFMIGWDI